MAQLKSLSIGGKDLTNSLTQTASTTINLENVYQPTTATYVTADDWPTT